jgi:hypothetical protein
MTDEYDHYAFPTEEELARRSLSVELAAEFLDCTQADVRRMLKRNRLLAFEFGPDEHSYFPAWQFEPSYPTKTLPGLADLLDLSTLDTLELSRWVYQPHPGLYGRRPLEALQEGRVLEVLKLVTAMEEGLK